MITNMFEHPKMITQTPDDEFGVAEPALACSIDSSGYVVIEQEGRHIILNKASIPDLIKVLREYKNL